MDWMSMTSCHSTPNLQTGINSLLTVLECGGDDRGGGGPLPLRVVRPRHHLVRRELAEAAQRELLRRRARRREVEEFEARRAAHRPETEEEKGMKQ